MSRAECLYTVTGSRNHVLEAIPGATVWVYQDGTSTPITQTLWSAEVGGIAQSNPLTSDANGTILFWLDAPQVLTLSKSAPGWQTSVETIFVAGGGGAPTGAAGGDLTGTFPNPTLRLGSATGGVLGTDVATLVSGKLSPAAQIQEVIALADLTDVSGTFPAGAGLRRNNTGFKANGLRFSMAAYGVVPCLSSDATTSAANSTARDACLAAALASGDGTTVELDWIGTACFSTAGTIYTRLNYVGTVFNISKMMDGAAAGTHVWQTLNFTTLTQTPAANFGVGAWEFSFRDHVVDGNKANNASGGHCLAIFGYGYTLDNLILQNAHSAGWWSEWNFSGEPLGNPPGSNHQRAFYVGTIRCILNDCANVAAVNQRLTEGRGAITGGQACIFGPGDSYIDYIECYRDGSVSGIGFNQGAMDFNAGSYTSFNPVITTMVIWLNHSTGLYLAGSGAQIGYLHCEGATTCVNINSQGVHIEDGRVFFAQPAGTDFLISSGCNGGRVVCNLENTPQTGVTKLNMAGGIGTEADFNFYLDVGSALPVTLTAGSLPSGCKRIVITANNYAGATVTPGWLPLKPNSTTLYGLDWHSAPILSTNGFGYTTGAGGTVTQVTSKATGVTLNALSGAITMNAAALAAATTATFTVTNNRVAATDVVLVSIKSGATAGSYQATVDAVAAGSFNVSLRNISAGSLSEGVVLNFAVIKAANS